MHDFLTWASESYRSAFSEWLGIHFIVRTLVLLLLVWIALYIAAKVFHYIIAPLLILLFYHGLFRAYNFLFVETPMEWLYIKYYSEDKTLFSGTYLKLCDKVKQNRMKLAHTRYMGIIYQGHTRRAAKRLLIISLIAGSLWVTAFGIFNEFAMDAEMNNFSPVASSESTPSTESAATEEKSSETAAAPNTAGALTEPSPLPGAAGSGVFVSDFPDPVDLPEDGEIIFTLNRYGVDGANIRDLPNTRTSRVLEAVWGDMELEYLREYYLDPDDPAIFWMKIKTPSGTEGYISSLLLAYEAD